VWICGGTEEDVAQIIFLCPMVKFVWCVIRKYFARNFLPGCRDNSLKIFLSCFWSLWLTGNDCIFEHKVSFAPFNRSTWLSL
jgi:hypothetical protein